MPYKIAVLYQDNWQSLPIPRMIALFVRSFPYVTFLPSSTVIYKLQSVKKGSCVVLQNTKLSTIYYIPGVDLLYKVECDKTTQFNNRKIQLTYNNQMLTNVPGFCAYENGSELFIEHLNYPRFKAAVVVLADDTLQLTIVKWFDDEPPHSGVADAILKEAHHYIKGLQKIKIVKAKPDGQKEQSKPIEYYPAKPSFCVYNVWGESFIEHQQRPRFKAKIILNDKVFKLEVVVWIDDEPKDPARTEALLEEASKFVKEHPPQP